MKYLTLQTVTVLKNGDSLKLTAGEVVDLSPVMAHDWLRAGFLAPVGTLPKTAAAPAADMRRGRVAQQKIMRKSAICITTVIDRNYRLAARTLFQSIRRHTDCTGIDFKIITADPEVVAEFGAENCHVVTDPIRARYADVKYSKELPPEKYHTSWYRYEIFAFDQYGYERVICIDSDCLCLNDISYLFSEELNQYDLISVEDHIVSKCFTALVPELTAQGLNFRGLNQRRREGKIDIQPALLVANRKIVSGAWYMRLLDYANSTDFTYSIDEGILNDFIYQDGLRIKLLPLEWDYQDLYEIHCPTLPVPKHPIIVHCQESKPFIKERASLDPRMHKWHDRWWEESRTDSTKTIIAIIVWNRFDNLKRWLRCWDLCDHAGAELIVVHNLETNNDRYMQLCQQYKVRYVPRKNTGFDIGAFQDVCKDRLPGFPTDWANLLWITDDCIPMQKDFVAQYLKVLQAGRLPCYEISDEVKRHVRTTGFLVTREIARRLIFPRDPISSREDCYTFEHKGFSLYEQLVKLGFTPRMVTPRLEAAPLWDSGVRKSLNLMPRHEKVFSAEPIVQVPPVSAGFLDDLAIKYKSDKSSLYHNFATKYDRLLASSRESATSILEIGVAQGQSLRMWADYFPQAAIHGADISRASRICETYNKRIRFHLADQNDLAQLKNLEQFGPFDLIIDDGNHFWREQIVSFEGLFPYVKPGGLYIVEDSVTAYWPEYKNHPISCVEYFKKLIDDVNFHGARGRIPANPPPDFNDWHKGWHRREDCQDKLPDFESIQFMNSLIVIRRRWP